jgi:hypothetical protein
MQGPEDDASLSGRVALISGGGVMLQAPGRESQDH